MFKLHYNVVHIPGIPECMKSMYVNQKFQEVAISGTVGFLEDRPKLHNNESLKGFNGQVIAGGIVYATLHFPNSVNYRITFKCKII